MTASPLPDRLRERLQALAPVRLAAVFGSTARGDARAGSDVDLALVLEPDSPRHRRDVEAELAQAAGREVDFVYLDSAPPLLRFEVARDGVLLLERRPHDWSDFRARAMIDWWDWAPTARLIEAALIRRLREKTTGGPT